MVFMKNRLTEDDKSKFTLKKTNFGYSLRDQSSGFEWEFDYRKVEESPDILYIARNRLGQPTVFWQSEINSSRGTMSSLSFQKKVQPYGDVIAVIGIEKDKTKHHIFMIPHCYTLESAQDIKEEITGQDVFYKNISGLKHFIDEGREKLEALRRFSEFETISALEMQVDLLTEAVKTLAATHPNKPVWWDSFIQKMENQSVVKSLGRETALELATKEKEKLRKMQSSYYKGLKAKS